MVQQWRRALAFAVWKCHWCATPSLDGTAQCAVNDKWRWCTDGSVVLRFSGGFYGEPPSVKHCRRPTLLGRRVLHTPPRFPHVSPMESLEPSVHLHLSLALHCGVQKSDRWHTSAKNCAKNCAKHCAKTAREYHVVFTL